MAPSALDLGNISFDEPHRFSFIVENTSASPVKITETRTSCTCSNVSIQGDKTLGPGEKRKVLGDVAFGRSPGYHSAHVIFQLETANASPRVVKLLLHATIITPLVVEKSAAQFSSIDVRGGVQRLTIEMARGNSGEQWDTIVPTCTDPHTSAWIERVTADRFRMTVQLDPSDLPIAAFRSVVSLAMYDGQQRLARSIDVDVLARAVGPLKSTPPSLYIGTLIPDQAVERSFLISSSELDLKGLAIGELGEGITAKVERIDSGTVRILATITVPRGTTAYARTITVTHRPSGRRINVRVIGATKKSDSL